MDADDWKNYGPLSNLTFMSKLVERVIPSRLTISYLGEHGLMPQLQSRPIGVTAAQRRHCTA